MADPDGGSGPDGPGRDSDTGRPSPEGDTMGADEERLRRHAQELAAAVPPALSRWVVRSVHRVATAAGRRVDDEMDRRADELAQRCADEVGGLVAELLARDIDDQQSTPLTLMRDAVRYPTQVLAEHGVAPVERDDFERRAFPDDRYGLAPASFADVDESLHEPGLIWGAAKAHVHLARRRADGQL